MQLIQRASRFALLSMAAIILAACASQKEPAQKLIADIESTVTAASAEAAKYVPDQLMDVQSKLGTLKASFDKQDYASVVTGAPVVLAAAQGLATAAAAKKDEVMKALNDAWTGLAASLPGNVTAIQARIDQLSKKSSKKLAQGIDLNAAKSALDDATSMWSKAQAAFASGNLDEAVTTAKDVKAKLDAVATSVKLDLAAPATPSPESKAQRIAAGSGRCGPVPRAFSYRAKVPSLTMTAVPPISAAIKLPSSTSSFTLTCPGRFICRPWRPRKPVECLPNWPRSQR